MAKKKVELAKPWKAVTTESRSRDCLMWLWLHDEMTDSQFEAIKRRLNKKYQKEQKA